MLTLAIIGAGPLGRSLALRASQAGMRVLLEDVMPTNLTHAQEALRLQLGPLAAGATDSPLKRIEFVGSIEAAVRDADLAIDCVPDELESKLEILFLLDRMAPPRTVLLTPTTRLSIEDLASCTYRAGQCVAIAMEASDLALAPNSKILLRTCSQTAPETVALVESFWKQLGYLPIFVADSVLGKPA